MIQPKITAALGKSGLGKTYAIGWILARMIRRRVRPFAVIVHDRVDPSYTKQLDPRTTKIVHVRRGAGDVSAAYVQQQKASGVRVLYFVVHDLTNNAQIDWLDSLMLAVRAVGDLALVIEEGRRFCKKGVLPIELVLLIRVARSAGVDIFVATHRLYDLDPDLRCLFTYWLAFQTTQAVDVRGIAHDSGVDAKDLGRVLRSLRPRHHVVIDQQYAHLSTPHTV